VLNAEPEHPVAWNGVGLVLAELKKFEDARNAFARAIQAKPEYPEAHYNLSFTLSNLGDFDGSVRETKRALELDPYYVPQKFELAIDLEYEDPELSIAPDLGGIERTTEAVEDFAFDPRLLDSLFTELTPTPASAQAVPAESDPYAMAADYLTKGLYDRAAAEASRALQRGGSRAEGLTLLGDTFARQGLHGEALERYREARAESASFRRALIGEARALLALGRGIEARPVAEELYAASREDVDIVMLVGSARAEAGDPAAALEALEHARRIAPARSDVHKKIGDILRSLGQDDSAIGAYRHALELDPDFAVVRYELARLLAAKGQTREAESELLAALDAVPTYAEATLELARIRRRTGAAREALELLIELLQRDPYHFDALLALGETLFELGRKSDAATAFRRVRRFDPEHVGAMYFEGVLLAEQHRYREAIERWHKVIDLEPAGEFARRARRDARTAADLQSIFTPGGAA
jgi:tetratricopeptide (TPR) repeat protein